MNNFDDWSQIISKYLHSEADPLNSLTKLEMEDDAARTAFIHAVLDRFLPEVYGVGSGQILDSSGKLSEKLDIIIYRRDFPRLDLPGSRDIYLYESVIATVEVVSKLVKKTFFEALDQCASLAQLTPNIDQKVLTGLAVRNQLTMNENRQYVHPDPIRTARFHLIARPISFIYGFSGYKTSTSQLSDTLQSWMDERSRNQGQVEMKDLPAVIATQGCFAWRNSAPFTVNEHNLMGIGTDRAPVRLIVLQMLHLLSRRLKVTTDGNGLKPGLDAYLNQMPPPEMEVFVGKAKNPGINDQGLVDRSPAKKNAESSASVKQVAKAGSKIAQASKPAPLKQTAQAGKQQTKSAIPTPIKKAAAVAKSVSAEQSIKKAAPKPEIEIKSRPSQPTPAVSDQADPVEQSKPQVNSLSSFNPKTKADNAPFPVPNADMVPELAPDPPEYDKPAQKPESANLQKPVTPAKKGGVDIELTSSTQVDSSRMVAAVDSAGSNFAETVKMKMQDKQKKPASPAEDFLETVKMNMASQEPIPHLQPESEPEPEPFTSTIPQ